jgi:hypothetical protein
MNPSRIGDNMGEEDTIRAALRINNIEDGDEWCCGIIVGQIMDSQEFATFDFQYCPHCGTCMREWWNA